MEATKTSTFTSPKQCNQFEIQYLLFIVSNKKSKKSNFFIELINTILQELKPYFVISYIISYYF